MVASTAVAAAASTSVLGPLEPKLRVAAMLAPLATCYDISDIGRGDSLRCRRVKSQLRIYGIVAHFTI